MRYSLDVGRRSATRADVEFGMGPSAVRNVAVYATTAHALTTASSPATRESCSSYRLIGAVPYTGIIITRVALTYSEISVSKLLRIVGRH